jgi:hypothetical protein
MELSNFFPASMIIWLGGKQIIQYLIRSLFSSPLLLLIVPVVLLSTRRAKVQNQNVEHPPSAYFLDNSFDFSLSTSFSPTGPVTVSVGYISLFGKSKALTINPGGLAIEHISASISTTRLILITGLEDIVK